jgi:type II secretory pathway component PulF
VREGRSFSASLRNTSPSFGELYCNLAQAGEASGALPQILKRQVRYLTMIDELQSRVVQALIYPAFISLAGIVMIGVFMTVLVPQMTQLLTKTGQSMPFATRVLVASSGFLSHWWWAILLTIGGTVGTFVAYIKTEAGRLWWAEAQLKMPGVGPIMVSRFYVQFTQTLSTLVGNGIPLLNGLKLMTDATQNYYLRHLLEKIVLAVGEGGAFSRALKKVGHFPPLFIDMVTVGEQTGDMGLALEKVATRYDKELNRKIQTITALVQPVIIVAIALVVGLVAYAMVSGIFQMISGMRHRM